MADHEPSTVAARMIAVRGPEAALVRCDRYIDGDIRSEEPQSFWMQVREEILERR